MANNVKSEIKNTGFADIPCDETIHRDDNHIFHLCKWNIKDQFIGYSDVIFTHKDTHRLLHPDYTNSLNPYNVTLSSATLSRITNITNFGMDKIQIRSIKSKDVFITLMVLVHKKAKFTLLIRIGY